MKLFEDCELLKGNKLKNDSDNQFSTCEDCYRFDVCYKSRMGTTYMTKETVDKLIEIRNWIKEKYPDSCIRINDDMDDRYNLNESYRNPCLEPQQLLEDVSDFFKYEMLNLCGCGCPDLTVESIRDYLQIINKRTKSNNKSDCWNVMRKELEDKFGYPDVCSNGLLQYMAYDLDERGFTNHGSNISGAWIEDLGEKCLFVFDVYLKENYEEEGDESNV